VPSLNEEFKSYPSHVITGGSSGVGKSFLNLEAKLKPDRFFCNLSRREPGIKIFGKKLNPFSCDLAVARGAAAVEAEVEAFLRREVPGGRVPRIEPRGFGADGRFPEPKAGRQLGRVDVNVHAVMHLMGRLLPLLRERGGAMISLALLAAFPPTAFMAACGAFKAFVVHWSLAHLGQLGGSGVRTLAVYPGPTATDFFRQASLPAGRVAEAMGRPCDEGGARALAALAAGRSEGVPGWKNKRVAIAGLLAPKPFAARVAAVALARFRLPEVSR
jgi:short-subunit dehydrogenase